MSINHPVTALPALL